MNQTFPFYQAHEARKLVLKYRCATCWGPLVEHLSPDARESTVTCAQSDDACDKAGFVTQAYVQRRQSEDMSDMSEAKDNLPFLKPDGPRSVDEIVSELFPE